jgi:hypothetical protein
LADDAEAILARGGAVTGEPERWALASLAAALLAGDGAGAGATTWPLLERLAGGLGMPSDPRAALFFRVLPGEFVGAARAVMRAVPLALSTPGADDSGYGWAFRARVLVDSVALDELPQLLEVTERGVAAGHPRELVRSAAAARYARLGFPDEALNLIGEEATREQVELLQELAFTLPDTHLPAWVAATCRTLRVPERAGTRAAVLAAASSRWAGAGPEVRRAAVAAWADPALPPMPRRDDLALEVVGLSGLLLAHGANGPALNGLVTSDLSLRDLSSWTARLGLS